MQRIILGKSGLDVPVLSVGTAHLDRSDQKEAVRILHRGFELGATWWDTADTYGTEALVGEALAWLPRSALTISSKITVNGRLETKVAVEASLRQLGTDYLDIMFMHFVRDEEDYAARQDCLEALYALKEAGVVRAIGFSSHFAVPLMLAATEPRIDVIMAPWNVLGHTPDGKGEMRDVEEGIRASYHAKQGVILMKVLNDGELRPFLDRAVYAAADFPEKHALCIGVKTLLELETNIRLVNHQPVDASVLRFLMTGRSDGRRAA